MNNQAAQTMPELPPATAFLHNMAHNPLYTANQMHQYARDYAAMLAAAPAASGGEDVGRADCGACPKPIGCKVGQCRHGLDNTPESRAPQLLAAASVSELARDE